MQYLIQIIDMNQGKQESSSENHYLERVKEPEEKAQPVNMIQINGELNSRIVPKHKEEKEASQSFLFGQKKGLSEIHHSGSSELVKSSNTRSEVKKPKQSPRPNAGNLPSIVQQKSNSAGDENSDMIPKKLQLQSKQIVFPAPEIPKANINGSKVEIEQVWKRQEFNPCEPISFPIELPQEDLFFNPKAEIVTVKKGLICCFDTRAI